MNVVETIREKVFRLPPKAQEEVMRQVEQIEEHYHTSEDPLRSNGNGGIRALFGSISLGHSTGADNESIDADLGREYMNKHEDQD